MKHSQCLKIWKINFKNLSIIARPILSRIDYNTHTPHFNYAKNLFPKYQITSVITLLLPSMPVVSLSNTTASRGPDCHAAVLCSDHNAA